MAVIDLPPDASANHRAQLVNALASQQLQAVPAIHQENRLYISIPHSPNENQAKNTLASALNNIATTQPELGISPNIDISPHNPIAYDPNKDRTGLLGGISKFMGDNLGNAGRYSGMAYSVGNVALLTNALFNKHIEADGSITTKPDFWKTSTAVNFILSSTILTLFASQSRDPASMANVFDELDNKIRHKLEKEGLDEQTIEQLTSTAKNTRNEVVGLLQKYPWEIAGTLNMAASASLTASAFTGGRRNWFQGAAGVIGLTSLAAQTLVPPKNGKALFNISHIIPEGIRNIIGNLFEKTPILRPIKHATESALDTIQNYRLQISGALSITANMSFMLSALVKHDWRLALTSTTFMLGDFFKAISPTPPELHRDDVAFAAATYLSNMQEQAAQTGTEPLRVSELMPLMEEHLSIVHHKDNIADVQAYAKQLSHNHTAPTTTSNGDSPLAHSAQLAHSAGAAQAAASESSHIPTLAQEWPQTQTERNH